MNKEQERIERLREYYDNNDTSEEMDTAEYDDTVVAAPMVTYALRMPAAVLDQLRECAAKRGMPVTALMREWLEERLVREQNGAGDVSSVRVSELLAFIAENRIVEKPKSKSKTKPKSKRA